MKKSKTQKGITLVALIITIVVLLILSVVAIQSIQNDGILSYAQNAAKDYNQAQKNEQDILEGYLSYMPGNKTYKTGEVITLKDKNQVEHSFYVLEDGTDTLKLLAKENINTTTLLQADADSIAFSSLNYWTSVENITYPYDLIESEIPDSNHYALYAAYQYGLKFENATGRLMYYLEAEELKTDYANMLFGRESSDGYLNSWLGTAAGGEADVMVWIIDGSGFVDQAPYALNTLFRVRPVIVIDKTK